MFRFEQVTYATATKRSNDLIVGVLDALNAYRATVDKPPLSPWARMRLCTAYLKHRVQERYIASLGFKAGEDAYDQFVGLRHDEPGRIMKLREQQTAIRSYRCPLDDAGITKEMVNAFWATQDFDLELEHDYQGNCTGCFLKDESDLARALGEEETDAPAWFDLQRRFPGFGGRGKPSYEQLLAERPLRLAMEQHFRGEQPFLPTNDGSMTPRRYRLVYFQERDRYANGPKSVSCACEQSIALADVEDPPSE